MGDIGGFSDASSGFVPVPGWVGWGGRKWRFGGQMATYGRGGWRGVVWVDFGISSHKNRAP